jgi:hypothetical protein
MATDSPSAIGAKGGKCNVGGGVAVRGNCQSWEPSRSRQPLKMGWPPGCFGMEDCDQCLLEDNLAALVSKRAQADEKRA